jgi:hypothetical protein
MAKSKGAKAAKKVVEEEVQQPTPPIHDEIESESDVDFIMGDDDDEPEEKDDEEEELERLVFGDNAGFREGLKDFTLDGEDDDTLEGAGRTGLEGMDDAAVGHVLWEWNKFCAESV